MENERTQEDQRKTIEGVVVDAERPKPYGRLEGEPVEWFARFQHFLLQGNGRTLNDVYRAESAAGHLRGHRGPCKAIAGRRIQLPGAWKDAVKQWDWYGRAASYDLEQLEAEKRQVESDRATRRQQVLDQEWEHSQLMLKTASESLKHGHKFFERTVRLQPGKFVETKEVDPKTGHTIITRTKVDREVVYLELKVSDINRMLMDGGTKARMAVGMTTEKAQEDFLSQKGEEPMDVEAVDKEIYEMFEALGVKKRLPPALAQSGSEPGADLDLTNDPDTHNGL